MLQVAISVRDVLARKTFHRNFQLTGTKKKVGYLNFLRYQDLKISSWLTKREIRCHYKYFCKCKPNIFQGADDFTVNFSQKFIAYEQIFHRTDRAVPFSCFSVYIFMQISIQFFILISVIMHLLQKYIIKQILFGCLWYTTKYSLV